MSCGTPVVVTKFGGIRKALTDGKDALLVDVSDENAFADAMVRVLQDDDLRAKMGQAALRTAHDHFSWDAIAKTTLAFYERYV
jgi:glycosyltransferase involved in cell wall biosynthesis